MVIQAGELLAAASGRWGVGVERDSGAKTLGPGNWLDEKEVGVRVASWLWL